MDEVTFEGWLDRYAAAWISNEPAEVADLFAEDAEYRSSPFAEPWVGRDAIVKAWVGDPEQQDDIHIHHDVIGVGDGVGIARASLHYTRHAPEGAHVEADAIYIVAFDHDGRCTDFIEWFVRKEGPLDAAHDHDHHDHHDHHEH